MRSSRLPANTVPRTKPLALHGRDLVPGLHEAQGVSDDLCLAAVAAFLNFAANESFEAPGNRDFHVR